MRPQITKLSALELGVLIVLVALSCCLSGAILGYAGRDWIVTSQVSTEHPTITSYAATEEVDASPTPTATVDVPAEPVALHPVESGAVFPYSIFIEGPYSASTSDGWAYRSFHLVLVNTSAHPIELFGSDTYQGVLETEEGRDYELEFALFGFGNYRYVPVIDVPLEIDMPSIPPHLPFRNASMQVKYSAAAHPTRMIIRTTHGDLYVMYDGADSAYPDYVIPKAELDIRPLSELLSVMVTNNENVTAAIDTSCSVSVHHPSTANYRLAWQVTLENHNLLDDEVASIQAVPDVFWGYYPGHFKFSQAGSSFQITVGPAQTVAELLNTYLPIVPLDGEHMLPDHLYLLFSDGDGNYRVAMPAEELCSR